MDNIKTNKQTNIKQGNDEAKQVDRLSSSGSFDKELGFISFARGNHHKDYWQRVNYLTIGKEF